MDYETIKNLKNKLENNFFGLVVQSRKNPTLLIEAKKVLNEIREIHKLYNVLEVEFLSSYTSEKLSQRGMV